MSFEQMLDLVRSKMPQTLVSSESFEQIRGMASHFPTRVASYLGFETKLFSDQAHVDFAFNLSNDSLGWIAHRDSPWPRINQFCALWGESGKPAYSDGNAVWLEFDASDGQLEPSLFFALFDPDPYKRSARGKSNRSIEWICRTLIETTWGRLVSPSLEQNLSRTLEICPEEVDLLQIGLMLSRNIQALRLCIFKILPQDVFPFLQSIGWSGDMRRLTQILERYAPFFVHPSQGGPGMTTPPEWEALIKTLSDEHCKR